MKKTLTLICLCIISFFKVNAQIPDSIAWQNVFGGSGYDHLFHTFKCSDGGFLLSGMTTSGDGVLLGLQKGNQDGCVIKTDSVGQLQWVHTVGGSGYDKIRYGIEDCYGDFVLLGSTHSLDSDIVINHGNSDAVIAKFDHLGNTKWIKTLGGTKEEGGRCVKQLRDSSYIFAIWTQSSDFDVPGNYGSYDAWIFKTDTALNTIWSHHYGGTAYDRCRIIYELDDGGFIFFGNSYSNDSITNDSLLTGNHGDSDFWLTRLDSVGNMIWTKQYGGSGDDKGYGLSLTTDGGFLICGYTMSNDQDVLGAHGGEDGWVVKIDSIGNIVWSRSMGGTKDDATYRVFETLDGGWVALGNSQSQDGDLSPQVHPHSGEDFWFIKFDSLNNIVFNECFGGTLLEQGNDILFEPNNSFVLAGISHSSDDDVMMNYGDEDFWIFKIVPRITNVGIFDPASVPFTFLLNDDNLLVKSPVTGKLKIEAFNTAGELAYSADLGTHLAGNRNYHLNLKGLSTGVYVFKMWINDKFQIKKLVHSAK